jgi:hypothetical protein
MGSANLQPGTQDLPARDPIKPHDDRAEVDVLREEKCGGRRHYAEIGTLFRRKYKSELLLHRSAAGRGRGRWRRVCSNAHLGVCSRRNC